MEIQRNTLSGKSWWQKRKPCIYCNNKDHKLTDFKAVTKADFQIIVTEENLFLIL